MPETMSVSGNYTDESQPSGNTLSDKLTSKTSFFSLRLYVVIAILLLFVLASLILIFLCVRKNRVSRKRKLRVKHSSGSIPLVSKEIVEIKASDRRFAKDCEKAEGNFEIVESNECRRKVQKNDVVKGEKKSDGSDTSGGSRSDSSSEPHNIGWGRWYSLKELELATRGFSDENVIGEGGYGIVYRGIFPDGSVVAVKNLLNNKYVILNYFYLSV